MLDSQLHCKLRINQSTWSYPLKENCWCIPCNHKHAPENLINCRRPLDLLYPKWSQITFFTVEPNWNWNKICWQTNFRWELEQLTARLMDYFIFIFMVELMDYSISHSISLNRLVKWARNKGRLILIGHFRWRGSWAVGPRPTEISETTLLFWKLCIFFFYMWLPKI